MDHQKPFERLASGFQISDESAKYFLGRVQKSFKKKKPPHVLILEVIEAQEFESLPEPYEVALLMKENGVWTQALHAPPPLILNDEDVE